MTVPWGWHNSQGTKKMESNVLDAEFAALAKRLAAIEDVTDPKRVRIAAEELRRMGYSLMLLVAPENLLEATRDQIAAELKRIRTMAAAELPTEADEADTVRVQAAMLLVTHYEMLVRLRVPDGAAWDEIIELYGED